MATPSDLRAQALELSREERARLARDLLASLDEPHDDPAEVETAWVAEVERRMREIDEGRAELVDWETVRAQAVERLKKA